MVESAELPEGTVRVPADDARRFVADLFALEGLDADDASLVADVLVSADLRGIRSHGVARVGYFVVRFERGVLNPHPRMELRRGSDTTGVLDADNGIGIVACAAAMDAALAMADDHGCGFVAVANSNHFGYAGYWAERAMRRGSIGISMSNSGRRATPTFGDESVLGTNPLAVGMGGAPGGTDFMLDMATTAVAVGKIETAIREGRDLPPGWVSVVGRRPGLDEKGVLSYDSPLLPLGGSGDEAGGHKGYGLNLMVELLCGALSGTPLSDRIAGADGHAPAAMAQLMGAIRIDGFRDEADVQAEMADTMDIVRGARKAPGHDRIYIHGEPEAIAEEENIRLGIPVTPAVRQVLESVGAAHGVTPPW
jgi:L-2-hydroxycarboxylate dehydrogenase (NAD+)